MRTALRLGFTLSLFLCPALSLVADYKDEIGFTALVNEGFTLPDGTGATVMQVEAVVSSHYFPDSSNGEFTGKTLTDVTGTASGSSSHATLVGQYQYGSTTSIMPATNTIHVYEANDWIGAGYLKTGSIQAPAIETALVQNSSWVGSSGDSTEILERLDYAINRDGFVKVVGVNNGSSNPLPELLTQGYNSISVGLTSGNHSAGLTTLYGAGRSKPEIVAPLTVTSHSTPVVSAAALLLRLEAEARFPADTDALLPELIKALLLAGATKEEFGEWQRTTATPLDATFGVGELNVQKSYHILIDGRQQPYPSSAGAQGWSTSTLNAGQSHYYFFEVPSGSILTRHSALLTWNRQVNFSTPTGTSALPLGELSLHLHEASAADPAQITQTLDNSDSSVDNIEHIYHATSLPPGFYALEVRASGTSPATDYALAWRGRVSARPTTYSSWSDVVFENHALTLSETSETGDPDDDGIENLMAYAQNMNPLVDDANQLPTVGTTTSGGDTFLTLSYDRRIGASDITYHVDWSTDLSVWDETGASITETSVTPNNDGMTERVNVTLSQSLESLGGDAFLRLRVVQ